MSEDASKIAEPQEIAQETGTAQEAVTPEVVETAPAQAADAKREAEMEEARKNSISFEEYAKAHPDSSLAKMRGKK